MKISSRAKAKANVNASIEVKEVKTEAKPKVNYGFDLKEVLSESETFSKISQKEDFLPPYMDPQDIPKNQGHKDLEQELENMGLFNAGLNRSSKLSLKKMQ